MERGADYLVSPGDGLYARQRIGMMMMRGAGHPWPCCTQPEARGRMYREASPGSCLKQRARRTGTEEGRKSPETSHTIVLEGLHPGGLPGLPFPRAPPAAARPAPGRACLSVSLCVRPSSRFLVVAWSVAATAYPPPTPTAPLDCQTAVAVPTSAAVLPPCHSPSLRIPDLVGPRAHSFLRTSTGMLSSAERRQSSAGPPAISHD